MAGEAERVDAYLATVGRLESGIHPVDLEAAVTSMAISLKRIADSLQDLTPYLAAQLLASSSK